MNQSTRHMTTQLIITCIIIGLAAGTLSGLVGVGGGIILVPAMVFLLSYSQHQAQGMSLGLLTLPVTVLAFLKYYYAMKGTPAAIDFKVIGLMAIGFFAGSYAGGAIAVKLNGDTLKKIFAIVLFYTGFKMLGWDMVFFKWLKGIF
jgi:uncharacterized protein